ncbi:prolyl oligopeptidase family serine peptidase [Brevibacillus fulvus]
MSTQNDLLLEITPEPAVMEGVSLFRVTYLSQGLRVKAALAVPDQAGPMPALLYCRGGLNNVGKVRPERISQLAAFGYIVFAPHYRGSEGGEGRDEFGGNDRQDVFSAYELLRTLPQVDPQRISLYGFSRGGMMALFAAMQCEGILAAVVWGGVSDLFLTYEERVDLRRMLRRIVGHPRKQEAAYRERSPVFTADRIRCPVLIIHGTEDQNVGVEHAYRLANALQLHDKPYELWLAEGATHLFLPELNEAYTRRMFEWLNRQVPQPV